MKKSQNPLTDYYASARLITELITLEDELRKVRYLSPFAPAPSIAHQITGVILISLALGNILQKNKQTINLNHILGLTLWHDAPEARYGDIGRDQRKYLVINEEKARADMFGTLSFGLELIELIEEFEGGGTDLNIKIAKDADALYVICTIKDLLEKGISINKPDVRIEKTLNRMTTEEGFKLGQEMAGKSIKQIWSLIKDYAGIDKAFTLSDSYATILAVAWLLVDLSKNANLKKHNVLNTILKVTKTKANKEEKNIAIDAKVLYELLVSKRELLEGKRKNNNFKRILQKLKTVEGKKLGDILYEIDLYDWWNLMMGYAFLKEDGSIEYKKR